MNYQRPLLKLEVILLFNQIACHGEALLQLSQPAFFFIGFRFISYFFIPLLAPGLEGPDLCLPPPSHLSMQMNLSRPPPAHGRLWLFIYIIHFLFLLQLIVIITRKYFLIIEKKYFTTNSDLSGVAKDIE